jgi:CheY-like chemotaxis protein
MLSRLLGEGIQLVLVPGAARSRVMADEMQIERLVLNLAVNARDAMPSGGVIRILTENAERPPDPESSDPGGLGVALVVQDTGQGMDAATRARLFEAGFSTRTAGSRRGLGLSIVQEVARQSSASIDCQTAPGRGATFRVTFPLAHAGVHEEPAELVESAVAVGEAPGARRERHAASRPPDRRNRVLVVDDDAEVRRVVHDLLEAAGFQVQSVPDGAQALALLKQRMVDAVLCDIFMPNKEGIETCSELRRRYPALRVVAMSGAAGATGYLRAAEKLGAVASLRKPFTGQELIAVVQGALAGRFR